jgi:hypothetical protein
LIQNLCGNSTHTRNRRTKDGGISKTNQCLPGLVFLPGN